MAIEVFVRYEKKFLIPRSVFEALLTELLKHMVLDKYNEGGSYYRIDNIYYDTESNDLIRKSIEKPIYKEKLRMRSYGVVAPEDFVFLELKKKFNGLVYKRRTMLKLTEAEEFMSTGIIPEQKPYMNQQVLRELAYFVKSYQVKPVLYLSYDRIALFGEGDSFRVTLDHNIRSRRMDLHLYCSDYGEQLLDENMFLMEAKTDTAYPLWFVSLLTHYKLQNISFSKYGTEYMQHLGKLSDGKAGNDVLPGRRQLNEKQVNDQELSEQQAGQQLGGVECLKQY